MSPANDGANLQGRRPMKTLIVLTLSLFSLAAFAGSISSGSYLSTTYSTSHATINGTRTSTEQGAGVASLNLGAVSRTEIFSVDNSTVEHINGVVDTSAMSTSVGGNVGHVGGDLTTGESHADGRIDTRVVVNDSTSGTFVEVGGALGQGYILGGTFAETDHTVTRTRQRYDRDTEFESISTFTAF